MSRSRKLLLCTRGVCTRECVCTAGRMPSLTPTLPFTAIKSRISNIAARPGCMSVLYFAFFKHPSTVHLGFGCIRCCERPGSMSHPGPALISQVKVDADSQDNIP